MIRYVRMVPEHLEYVHAQLGQQSELAVMASPAYVRGFEYSSGLTGFDGDRCIGCAGLIDTGRQVMLWAYLSADAGPYLLEITRKVQRVLETQKGKRLVTYVDPGFPQAVRWMRVLGFSEAGRCDILDRVYVRYEKGE